jgi:hypothetical protein
MNFFNSFISRENMDVEKKGFFTLVFQLKKVVLYQSVEN